MPISPTDIDDASLIPSSPVRVQVLAVGPWHEKEFQLAQSQIAGAAAWQTAADVGDASESLRAGETAPELILLAQPLPGQYGQKDIDHLQALAPLARIVLVVGSWCEGGLRSGIQLSGVLRLYWHEFAPWWKSAQARVASGLCPPWSLPIDNLQAGRSIPNFDESRPAATESGELVAINTKDFSVYESLAAALAQIGMAASWIQPAQEVKLTEKVSVGIWDGSQLDPAELDRLTTFCGQIRSHEATVVALLDYPRVEHFALAKEAGAAAVLGKPYVVDELLAALR